MIEVPPEEWKEEHSTICQQFQREARVPGFRPGRAPMNLVKQRYKESIQEEFLEKSMRKYLVQALKSEKLSPLAPPRVEEKELEFQEGNPLKFKVVFEILPALEINNYRGVEVERIPVEIKPEEVEHSIKMTQERLAEFIPVEDRPVQAGDFAVVSYKSRFLSNGTEGPHAEEVFNEVGAANSLPEFTLALTGMKIGESATFSVKYPENYPNKSLEGQELEYSLELKGIKLKQVPELNADFARNAGGHASMEEMQEKTRAHILSHRTESAQSDMKNHLLDRLIETNVIEVPEVLVNEQLDIRLNNYLRTLIAQGIHPQTLDIDWTEFRQKQRDRAINDVKSALILEYVADKEKVEVSDEEAEAEIEKIAQESHQSLEAVRARLTKDEGTDRIKDRIRNRKTLDLLLEWATIKEPQGSIIQS